MYDIDDVDVEKQKLRKFYSYQRESMSCDEKNSRDLAIYSNLIGLSCYISSSILLTYISKGREVDTFNLLQYSWNIGKIVAVPRCDVGSRAMYFYKISSLRDLQLGTYGIFEPIVSRCEIVSDVSNGVCVVPGLCFDKSGYRVGYGKGYYDRFLSHFNYTKVGLCYDNFVLDYVPRNCFDVSVDILVTDNHVRFINCCT